MRRESELIKPPHKNGIASRINATNLITITMAARPIRTMQITESSRGAQDNMIGRIDAMKPKRKAIVMVLPHILENVQQSRNSKNSNSQPGKCSNRIRKATPYTKEPVSGINNRINHQNHHQAQKLFQKGGRDRIGQSLCRAWATLAKQLDRYLMRFGP